MKPQIDSTTKALLTILLTAMLFACDSKKSNEQKNSVLASSIDYEVSDDKSALEEYYKLDQLKEWYPERFLPPPFDYNIDISKKTPAELSLLRNEIFARNGYLFDDAVLRGYFNQFKWYQPIFDVPNFKVKLNKREEDFIAKVLNRENELAAHRYVKRGEYQMVDLAFVHNMVQFKNLNNDLTQALAENNFAIAPGKHEQFFHVYDENSYEYIPNFITTDLYLQVLHKHFSTMLQKIEEQKLIPIMKVLLKDAYDQALLFQQNADPAWKTSAQWSATYLAIAHSLLNNETVDVPAEMRGYYDTELSRIQSAQGKGSEFLDNKLFQYSQFEPRGNYTKTDTLKQYFRCIKWLNTATIYVDDDPGLASAMMISSFIRHSPESHKAFETFNSVVRFIVGEEDNLSISNLMAATTDQDLHSLADKSKLAAIRKDLLKLQVDRIRVKGATEKTDDLLERPAVLFTAGRYTIDAEILSRLVHVLRPTPLRPFPKGLDVFAALGNKEAENILVQTYHEPQQWPAYTDSLAKLKKQFSGTNDWDGNVYSKTSELIKSINCGDADRPLFMKTPAWDKRNLITSLAAWTELKHDMLLYAEQPGGAEAGEGGGPPPPKHVSYVEPNILFWQKSIELIQLQEKTLSKLNLMTDDILSINKELREIAELLLAASKKEIARQNLTDEEFEGLTWLGGRIEYLTFRIYGSDHLPEKERLIALVADVYNYNGRYLEEGVGLGDDIYVIAEINGIPYLTKGTVFSYYEFTSESPLTDEAWQRQLLSGQEPERPKWTKSIMIKSTSLESKPSYSF